MLLLLYVNSCPMNSSSTTGLYLSVGSGVLVIQVPEDLPLDLSATREASFGAVDGHGTSLKKAWFVGGNSWKFHDFPGNVMIFH